MRGRLRAAGAGLLLLAIVSVVVTTPAGASAPTTARATLSSKKLVNLTFSDFLDAPASPTSLADWSARITAGTTSQASFVAYVAASGSSVREQISRLYYRILRRQPTPAVLTARVAAVQHHTRTVAGMAEELYASSEYVAASGGFAAPWVHTLYVSILGRAPSASSLATRLAQLASHGHLYVADQVYGSAEARTDRVRALYRRMLHTTPSAASLAHWVSVDAAAAGDVAVSQGLASSAGYLAVVQHRNAPVIISPYWNTIPVGEPFTRELEAGGGSGTFSWQIFGLHSGLAVETNHHVFEITGDLATAPPAGPVPTTLVLTDSDGAMHALSLPIRYVLPTDAAGVVVHTAPNGGDSVSSLVVSYGPYTVGSPVSDQLVITGGVTPYSVAASGLPAGVVISPTGAISGTPTVAGLAPVQVTVTDRVGTTMTQEVRLATEDLPQPLSSVTQVFSWRDACAAAGPDGQLYCWGSTNWQPSGPYRGETNRPSPVFGLTHVTHFGLGTRGDDCAVANGGNLYCGFGAGSVFGLWPQQVPGISAVTDVITMWQTSWLNTVCAIHDGGHLACWGDNTGGALGAGLDPNVTSKSDTPVDTGLTGVTAVQPVDGGFCAIASGHVWCWGSNSNGGVGDGTTSAAWSPVEVTGPTSATSLTSWNPHTGATICAVAGGNLWCWGWNETGEIGDGTRTNRLTPYEVPGLSSVTDVSMSDQTCAVATVAGIPGTLSCWGEHSTAAGPIAYQLTPATVPGLTNVSQVATRGGGPVCAVADPSATLYCWDGNTNGDGTTNYSEVPVSTGLSDVASAPGSGWNASDCAVKVDGTLWCWGLDGSSTGTGSTGAVLSPTQVHLGSPSASVASVTGSFAVYALTTDGRLFGWGEDSEGEVGDGNTARVAKVVDPFQL